MAGFAYIPSDPTSSFIKVPGERGEGGGCVRRERGRTMRNVCILLPGGKKMIQYMDTYKANKHMTSTTKGF